MREDRLGEERARLERDLRQPGRDITGAYMAVGRLGELLSERPETARPETVDGLAGVLASAEWTRHRQAFFLFRSAADTLAGLGARLPGTGVADLAMARLSTALREADGAVHRAAAEALGGLPLPIRPPAAPEPWDGQIAEMAWDDLPYRRGVLPGGPLEMLGRSATVPIRDTDWRLVLKFARSPEDAAALHREAAWSDRLRALAGEMGARFDGPRPLRVRGAFVFRVRGLPRRPPGIGRNSPAIGLIAPLDYFGYPNGPDGRGRPLRPAVFRDVMARSARLFGRLTGGGIVHAAPIPLFHNRVQRDRREDGGAYEWWRGGRLDRWLFSCRYPNFGRSGLRDLEHLTPATGGFYEAIGTQLLSLLLVAGSYYRNHAPERMGWTAEGEPVDARDLFDAGALRELVERIFREFYAGFSGWEFRGAPPVDFPALADRMVAEMGVDRHMEEVLRLPDQERMSDAEFRAFLTERGMRPREVASLRRGEREIVLPTGPHLGEFNGRISLPEMIRFLETAAALCVAGRFGANGGMVGNGWG